MVKISKKDLVREIIGRLEELIAILEKAAHAAEEGATHEEAVAKSKYDTHGLELSYLAGTQKERHNALLGQINRLKQSSFPDLDDSSTIETGALVTLKNGDHYSHIFLSPIGAGMEIQNIKILSPESPFGDEMVGLSLHSEFEFRGSLYQVVHLE